MGKTCSKGTEIKRPLTFDEKYELSSKLLGEGAYGKVVLGVTRIGREKVAVKMMDKRRMNQRDDAKMHKEVAILKSLNHKNVVKVYDFFDDEDFFKIVMEYVDGGELFEKLVSDEGQYTEEQSRDVILTLVQTLNHCKDRGVVHRDIKPENILLTKEGELKLADFNLSKQLEVEKIDFKLLQTMCGTPNYVAPEVLGGRSYDFKCDVWSLGVIAFLLLSGGYLPFFVNPETEGKAELLQKVKRGRWGFVPESAWADVSKEAKDLLTHMLDRHPDSRFNYDQILAHHWFKVSVKDTVIDGTRILSDYEKKRIWVAAHVYNAAETLASMMGPREADDANRSEGNYLTSQRLQTGVSAIGISSDDMMGDGNM